MTGSPPLVVAVVATCGRRDVLLSRALPSIWQQTRPPDLVVVSIDEDADVAAATKQAIEHSGRRPPLLVDAIVNSRTPQRASGSWNTAALHTVRWALQRGAPLQRIFLALLDDDDAWLPTHVATCVDVACHVEPDVVVSGLIRDEGGAVGARDMPIPQPRELTADAFLTSNPGVQGSNMFIRLSTFLRAGMFDEALRATTDRDLMVRVCDVGAAFAATSRHTVRHYAPAHGRLSTCHDPAKMQGADGFLQQARAAHDS